ncbi:hypothetical protein [Paenibacillus puerhi]|uniref:hypothetical protein n=1 Tax=Paenibacillus puerhi TaxID=2692622 RepID=UPI00135AA808|nr:hypothetical protein [Paenibacillus puerhi]
MYRRLMIQVFMLGMCLLLLVPSASAQTGEPYNHAKALFNLEETWFDIATGEVVGTVTNTDRSEFYILYYDDDIGYPMPAMVSLDGFTFRIRDLAKVQPTKYVLTTVRWFSTYRWEYNDEGYNMFILGQRGDDWVIYNPNYISSPYIYTVRYSDNGKYKIVTKVSISKFISQ